MGTALLLGASVRDFGGWSQAGKVSSHIKAMIRAHHISWAAAREEGCWPGPNGNACVREALVFRTLGIRRSGPTKPISRTSSASSMTSARSTRRWKRPNNVTRSDSDPVTPTICPLVFHRKGKRIKSYRKAWQKACEAAGCPGRLMHDFRRTAFAISSARACRAVWRRQSRGIGEAVYRRYAIVSSGDLADASRKLQAMTGTIGLVTDNTQNTRATA